MLDPNLTGITSCVTSLQRASSCVQEPMAGSGCRVVRRGYPRPTPEEPCMRVSQHTARASAKALLSTQLYLFNIGVLLISGATQMVDLKIDCGVRSTVRQLYDMATR